MTMLTDDDLNYLRYNAKDASVTLECANAFMDEIDDEGYRWTYDFTVRLFPPLTYMMTRGILADLDKLEKAKIAANSLIDEKQAALNELAGEDLNPNSPKELKQYFYIKKGIEPYTKAVKTPGGRESRVTVDDKALQRLARGTSTRRGLPEAKLIQELRGLKKLVGTYLDITFDSDNRMRCSYNPRGTKYGRLSSSKTILGTGTNMQNLPEEFKGFLVSDPGCIFFELDKSGAEWVVVAYTSGDAMMIKCCEERRDPHVFTAMNMYGCTEELVVAENKVIGHVTDPVEITALREKHFPIGLDTERTLPRTMSMRQAGKKSNHGLNYDESFVMFALINEILNNEAKEIIEFYHHTYPGVRQNHARIKEQLRESRTLYNCFGRKVKFLDRWGPDLWKSAYSMEPQSTVSDLVNLGICETYEDTHKDLADTEILANVHDSCLFQHPSKDVDSLARAIIRAASHFNPTLEARNREYKIPTDLKIGYNWRDMEEVALSDDPMVLASRLEKAIAACQRGT